jgi:glycolate oxidase iron-sulfur subunit
MDAGTLVDYAASLDCIHCGLCLRTCPTYQLTGVEASSPRGRIYMMRGVAEGRLDAGSKEYGEELDFCLVCRHCESACPAGVRFGEMMEHARDSLGRARPRTARVRLAHWLGFGHVLRSRFLMRVAFSALGLAQRTSLLRVLAPLLGARGATLRFFPRIPSRRERRPMPAITPARGAPRARAALLEGCVMRELYGRVNRATADSLAKLGVESHSAPGHVCCGALHAHNGELEGARELARATIRAFEDLRDPDGAPLPVVVNSAGCGAHMKSYGRLLEDDPTWKARALDFSARVRDYSEFCDEACPDGPLGLAGPQHGRVTFDDPCHLCHGQQIRSQPRKLLDRLVGLERVELEGSESCCGSAGIYSLLRPTDSAQILAPKLDALERSGAEVLVTANPGCQLQWETGLAKRGSSVRVLHIAELLGDGA